ncbi:hypothetical protein Hdeb2414_s0844g00953161 [Helianthus debilis subsp. tardiflorus]
MGLSQKWLCTLLLIISVVFHMSVITRGDERLETEGWGRDPCRFRRRGCGRFVVAVVVSEQVVALEVVEESKNFLSIA